MFPNIKNDTLSVACQGNNDLMLDVCNNFNTLFEFVSLTLEDC